MKIDQNSQTPIFLQIAQQLEDAIFMGIYPEEEKIPSTNEISLLLNVNPHTVLNGMNLLVEQEIIYKKRGLGMYVCRGAINKIHEIRNSQFNNQFILPLVNEANKLNIKYEELVNMIKGVYDGKSNSD